MQNQTHNESSVSLRTILEVLWRRKTLFLLALAIAAFVGLTIGRKLPSDYESRARLLVNVNQIGEDLLKGTSGIDPTILFMAERERILADERLLEVAQRLNLSEHPEFVSEKMRGLSGADLRFALVNKLRAHLDVKPIRSSLGFNIIGKSSAPELSAKLANTLVDVYIDSHAQARSQAARTLIRWLENQIDEAQRHAVQLESDIQRIEKELEALQFSPRTPGAAQIGRLTKALTSMALQRAEILAAIPPEAGRSSGNAADFQQKTAALGLYNTQSEEIDKLRSQLNDLRKEKASLSRKFGPKHPEYKRLSASIEETRTQLAEAFVLLSDRKQNQLEIEKSKRSELNEFLEAALKNKFEHTERELQKAQIKDHLNFWNSRIQEAQLRIKRVQQDTVLNQPIARILSYGVVPKEPSDPGSEIILALALIAGAFTGFGLVALREMTDHRIRVPAQLERQTGVNICGLVPESQQKRAQHQGMRPVPTGAVSESLGNIIATLNLKHDSSAKHAQSVLITGAQGQEGSSLICAWLGRMLAQSRQKVLIIDSDLKHASQTKLFDITTRKRTLNDLLEKDLSVSETLESIVTDPESGIDFLVPSEEVSGQAPPSVINFQETWMTLLKKLRPHYQWILIDGAPVLANTDTRLLSRQCEHVLFLVRWGVTNTDYALRGLQLLKETGATPAGFVINRIPRSFLPRRKARKA